MLVQAGHNAALAAAFEGVEDWIFDLDNTLYPPHKDLFPQVDKRITDFIAQRFDLSFDAAFRMQKDYYRTYGTSLRGLMIEHALDPHDFLNYVHDIDHSPLEPDPALGAALAALPGRKFVLTNGSRWHAENVTKKLGIDSHFEAMFGIVEAEFNPKPAGAPYEKFVRDHDISTDQAAMFEDIARNLQVPKALGMATVLVVGELPPGADWRAEWEDGDRDADYIDHVTDDLADFLITIGEALGADLAHVRDLPKANARTTDHDE